MLSTSCHPLRSSDGAAILERAIASWSPFSGVATAENRVAGQESVGAASDALVYRKKAEWQCQERSGDREFW